MTTEKDKIIIELNKKQANYLLEILNGTWEGLQEEYYKDRVGEQRTITIILNKIEKELENGKN
jgi:hypothetical protein